MTRPECHRRDPHPIGECLRYSPIGGEPCLGCEAGSAHRHDDAEDGPRAGCCDHSCGAVIVNRTRFSAAAAIERHGGRHA